MNHMMRRDGEPMAARTEMRAAEAVAAVQQGRGRQTTCAVASVYQVFAGVCRVASLSMAMPCRHDRKDGIREYCIGMTDVLG